MSVLTNAFPLLRGRTGVETILPDLPVVVRLYSGSIQAIKQTVKMRCVTSQNKLRIGVKPITVSYRKMFPGIKIDRVSYSIDYPILDQHRCYVDLDTIELFKSGTITLQPRNPKNEEKCLFTME